MKSLLLLLLILPIRQFAQSGTWGVTNLPVAATNLVAASTITHAYFSDASYVDTLPTNIYVYDAINNSWNTIHPPVRIFRPRIGALGNKLFICGDTSYYNQCDLIQIYNEQTSTWSTANLSTRRNAIEICSEGSKIYFCGGGQNGGGPIGSTQYWASIVIDIYDSISNSWSVKYMPIQRINHRAYAQNDKLFVSGGPMLAHLYSLTQLLALIY